MPKFLLIFAVAISLSTIAGAQTFYGSTDIKAFRAGRDAEFRNKEESALKPEDLAAFKGLSYFTINTAFRVEAAFKRTADEKYFEMPTSSGRTKKFVKYGILTFQLEGKPRQLSVYQIDSAVREKFPEYADLLFIPFRDSTNSTESYGGGRYLDIKTPSGSKVILDFNLAYNPKCAYGGDKYSCPIPPRENTIALAVTAGEKRYAYSGSEQR